MPKKITVKIQRPLFDSEGNYGKLLIYDKHRSFEGEVQLDKKTLDTLFPDGGHKNFARGFLRGTQFHIEHVLPEENWPSW